MRFDAENQLSVAQSFTGTATVSTNSYAKQSAAQDISIGVDSMMSLFFAATVAAGAGSTMQLECIQADDAALTTNVAQVASVSVLAANVAVGQVIELPLPKGSLSQQYIGARVTLTGGTTTVTADIYLMPTEDIAKYKSFPKVVDALV